MGACGARTDRSCTTPSVNALDVFLENHGLDEACRDVLITQHGIDSLTFGLLSEDDLREMGITRIGQRKRILFLRTTWGRTAHWCDEQRSSRERSSSQNSRASSPHRLLEPAPDGISLYAFDRMYQKSRHRHKNYYDPCKVDTNVWKTIFSCLYAFISLGITTYVMVIAHERVPDMSKYPPLPDIFLDNLPYIPWAFEAAELVGMTLCSIWLLIVTFHKHRLILIRRYCSLLGTVFLLRSITMIITSMSVPGRHLCEECKPFVFHSIQHRIWRAVNIWLGMGMTLRGVRTCGDYMFSGHTTVITMLNFFITEYTPSSLLYPLHTLCWVLNLFGVFFILAAHEHYSIDVFIAMYITSRLFLYYHWLASNHHLVLNDKLTAKIWFPLFTYFESDVRGVVPHEFSNPFLDFMKWCDSRYHRLCLLFWTGAERRD